MANQVDDKAMQEKYMELQMISGTMQEMQNTVQQLDQQLVEINGVKANIDSVGEQEVGSDMLVPVSNGIFAKGELKDNKELIVNVGSNVAVEKTIPEAKKLLDSRISELDAYRNKILQELEKVAKKAQSLEMELIKMMPSG